MNFVTLLRPEQPSFEFWHIPFFIAFAIIVCVGLTAITFDFARKGSMYELPMWWLICAGVGLFSAFTPFGIVFFLMLCYMIGVHNMGAGFVTLGYGFFMWVMCIRMWMPNMFARRSSL